MFEKAGQAKEVENVFDKVVGWLTLGMAGFTAFGSEGWINHLWESWWGPESAAAAGAEMGDMVPNV